MEIKWNDSDPETGEKRQLLADRFARQWRFASRFRRGEQWQRNLEPTLEMWEHVLDTLERRYRRRDGVDDEDIDDVKRILARVKQRLAAERARPQTHPGI
jgi:hypothetical protein